MNVEGLELDYLHLIDNLTGADIDLLVLNHEGVIAGEDPQSPAPSYTFTAKTTDYESRFKLVFSTQAPEPVEGPDQPFAFMSSGNSIVNGEGTLQVIDLLGRQLSSQEIHSTFSIPHSTFAPGVYVLRLIDKEKVRTQKMVIR